jgi:uncharacterized delta-60 repeat protein/LPXTG-motif cell wall-anchored protein
LATGGSLDTTFNTDGKVITDIGSSTEDAAESVAVQADGKIIVAGDYDNNVSRDFAVARYNTNGSLDTTFDTDGKVVTDIGTNTNDIVQSVAIQADGKILVAGWSDPVATWDFVVARYNANGSLDTTFDTDGKVVTDIGTNSVDNIYSVVVQSDGKIVVAGWSNAGGRADFVVVRYNTNGSLDTTFDTDGKVITDIGTNRFDFAYSAVLQADGKIVVAGNSDAGGTYDFVVVRYNTNGSLDTTFDSDGKVTTNIGTSSADYGSSVVVQSDGKIVVAGFSDLGSTQNLVLVRYNTNGSLDTTFDSDGKAISDIGSSDTDRPNSAVLQADGKIVVAGFSNTGGSNNFVVVRFNSNGSFDTTFGIDGKVSTDIGTNSGDQARSIVLQSDGKIVVAGISDAGGSDNYALVRYNATSLSAALASTSTTSSSVSITFTVTGTEAIDCTTLSTTSGVDFNLTGITEITFITQTSPTLCTIGATSQAVAGGVAVTSTLAAASSFSIGFANSNTRTTLSSSSQSVVVTIPAVVTSVSPTTTIVASTTTTVAAPTTTAAAVAISSTKKVTATKNELPETGSDSFPLVALAMGLISAGLVVTTRKRFARR